MWRRRAVLSGIVAPVFTAGTRAFAQPAGAPPIIGALRLANEKSDGSWIDGLRQGLRDQGLIEGGNVRLISRYADNQPERLVDLARDLVREGSRVIVTTGTTSVGAARQGAPDTPIVMAGSADPVAMGFAQSLARPGGRLTGISIYGAEIIGKQIEILREAVPGMRAFAAFLQAANPGNPVLRRGLEDAAARLGLRAAVLDIERVDQLAAAFEWVSRQSVDALHVMADPILAGHSRAIFKMALDYRLPTMAGNATWVNVGALMSYTIDLIAIVRRSAYYIREILRGADPATLPIEQPTEVSLAINMATARALGLRLPNSLLSRASMVVE